MHPVDRQELLSKPVAPVCNEIIRDVESDVRLLESDHTAESSTHVGLEDSARAAEIRGRVRPKL